MLPKNGEFPAEKRERWFQALAVNLDLVHGDGGITITRTPTKTDQQPPQGT